MSDTSKSDTNKSALLFAGAVAMVILATTLVGIDYSLTTKTAQDITAVTTVSGLLSGITYDKVSAVIVYPDATDQTAIEDAIKEAHGIT